MIALRSSTIHELIETASSIGSAGLIVVTLFGLFTTLGGPAAAIAAVITGAGVWLAGMFWEPTSVPYTLATALAALAYLAVSLIFRR